MFYFVTLTLTRVAAKGLFQGLTLRTIAATRLFKSNKVVLRVVQRKVRPYFTYEESP